ncbi:Eukaryotic translation initiation factor 3 subunit D [Lobulomyces angularis]|nr:Eukaryotic translation initiation factor 3 subunit D [Lobulomyces angularis]
MVAKKPSKEIVLPSFKLPVIDVNPNGFGPCNLPVELSSVPYAPYSKSERVGKVADWTAPTEGQYRDQEGVTQTRRKPRFGNEPSFGAGSAGLFMYQHSTEEEASFSVVDRATSTRKTTGFKTQKPRVSKHANAADRRLMTTDHKKRRYGYNDKPQRIRDSSVTVAPDWRIIEEIDFNRLNKLFFDVDEPEDIAVTSQLKYLDQKVYDRVSTKNDKILHHVEHPIPNFTSSDDPILQKFAANVTGATVFATDAILATLMCASRSVYSWDLVIVKEGNKIFIDKRYDALFVNENAADPPMESTDDNPNTPGNLSSEATEINRDFARQILKEDEKYIFKDSTELAGDDQPIGAYRYRKWDLGDDITLIARTQIDAAIHQPGFNSQQESEFLEAKKSAHNAQETMFVTVKALNEFDYKAPGAGGAPDWRQKLDSQRGAVMASEMKNNGNKLAKWTVESILSGADQIRLGFVSRVHTRDPKRHTVLGTTFFKPKEFANQINLNMNNAWGILRTIVDLCLKRLSDGKFVLVKDPNKTLLRLYQVPLNTFNSDNEDKEEDSD